MDLLAGFDEGWTALLAQLLSEDPSKRLPLPSVKLARGVRHPTPVWPVVLLGLVALGGIALYVASRPPHYDFDEFFPPDEEVMR